MIGRWIGRETKQSLILVVVIPLFSAFPLYFSACCWSVRLSESIPFPPLFSKMGGVRRRWGMFSTRMTLAKVWWFEASSNINNNWEINKLSCPGLGVRTQGGMRHEDSGGYNCLVEGWGGGAGWGVDRRMEGSREGKTVGALGRWQRQWG